MPIPDGAAALANTRELINFADRHKIPVYHVQHVAPAGSPVFAIDGETVKFHPHMQPRAKDVVLQKTTVSVFGQHRPEPAAEAVRHRDGDCRRPDDPRLCRRGCA
jgi:nicotinamidase-related amidase